MTWTCSTVYPASADLYILWTMTSFVIFELFSPMGLSSLKCNQIAAALTRLKGFAILATLGGDAPHN